MGMWQLAGWAKSLGLILWGPFHICSKFQDNPSSSCWEILLKTKTWWRWMKTLQTHTGTALSAQNLCWYQACRFWPAGGTKPNVSGSPKLLGFVLQGAKKLAANVTAIHLTAVEIFPSESQMSASQKAEESQVFTKVSGPWLENKTPRPSILQLGSSCCSKTVAWLSDTAINPVPASSFCCLTMSHVHPPNLYSSFGAMTLGGDGCHQYITITWPL